MVSADELDRVVANLRDAREPEDVFGVDGADPDENPRHVRAVYRRLSRIVHPDVNGGSAEAADAFKALESLWQRARQLLADGTYGTDRTPTTRIRTRRGEYVLQGRFAVGEVCDLFQCRSSEPSDPPFLAKVARLPRDNDLVQAEARTLRRLYRELDDRWQPFLPSLVEHMTVRAPGGIRRASNVLERLDGWHTLDEVSRAYPDGIDVRDVAWMWRRLLAVLGAVHEAGIVHGAVVPSNVLIHPEEHGLILADWCYAFDAESGRPAAVSRERWRYPAEVDEKRLTPSSDLYTAASLWTTLVSRENVPKPLRAHLSAYLLDERQRPTSAWQMLGHFEDVLERCYGQRRFRPFTMPA